MKLVSILFVLTAGLYAQADVTDAYYNVATYLPNCGGTIQTKCTDGNKCWVNISNTTCKGVRLYDSIQRINSFDYSFNANSGSVMTYLVDNGWGKYETSHGQLYVTKNQFRYSGSWWSENRYYVPVFVHRTDRDRPYDKVFLRFHSK